MDNPYITPNRVRDALRSLNLRPTRSMGQNFLTDPGALSAIVNAAELSADDVAVEVGPGLGVLTWELVQRAGQVYSVELDKRLAERIRNEFAGNEKLHVVESDILRISPAQILRSRLGPDAELPRYKLVANLPYAITSAALRHFLEADHKPDLMVVLVQWEVAKRIVAKQGDLSVLAHSVQLYAEPDIVERVPGSSFLPAPEVDSAVLRMRMRAKPAVEVDSIDRLMRVIKAGFLHGRKKLGNSLPSGLASIGIKTDKEQIGAALEAANVHSDRRAETLTLEEWTAIYNHLQHLLP
jgi:16S rRNA (adenine1518-N6/adenine1519-N6)-dimethyltransferase